MKNHSDIVKALAIEIAKKITRKTIFALQRRQFDDDSGLYLGLSAWDGICVQIQEGRPRHWAMHDLTVRELVCDYVSQLNHFEQLALWIQTDSYDYWYGEKQEDEGFPPELDDAIVEYLLEKYIYSEAWYWKNTKITNCLAIIHGYF